MTARSHCGSSVGNQISVTPAQPRFWLLLLPFCYCKSQLNFPISFSYILCFSCRLSAKMSVRTQQAATGHIDIYILVHKEIYIYIYIYILFLSVFKHTRDVPNSPVATVCYQATLSRLYVPMQPSRHCMFLCSPVATVCSHAALPVSIHKMNFPSTKSPNFTCKLCALALTGKSKPRRP